MDGEGRKLKTAAIIKESFNIGEQCAKMTSLKPKCSKNVANLYYNQIKEIATEYKQLFIDIAEKKEQL